MSYSKVLAPSQEPRAGVKWEGCSSAPDGRHALQNGESVHPYDSFVCRHCAQTVWWDFDPKGGY
jgi:hypothetical protein